MVCLHSQRVTAGTTTQNAHEIETGLSAGAAASIWHIQHIGSTIVFVGLAIGSKSGSYSVSSTGALAGTIAQTKSRCGGNRDMDGPSIMEHRHCLSGLTQQRATYIGLSLHTLVTALFVYSIFHPTRRESGQGFTSSTGQTQNTGTNIGNPSMRVGWVSASIWKHNKPYRGRCFSNGWPSGHQVSLRPSVAMEQQPGDNRNAGAYRAGTP